MSKLYKLTLIAIFAVPLFGILPIQGADIWYSQYLGLLVVFCLGISAYVWDKNNYISVFLIIATTSMVMGHSGEQIILNQNPRGMLTLIQLGFSILAIYTISQFSQKQKKCIYYILIALVAFQGVYVVLQYLNLDPIFDGFGTFMTEGRRDDTVGFSGSHNQIGVFFATTSPLITIMFPWLIPLVVYGLWNSTTSFAWASFLIISFITVWHFYCKRLLFIFLVLAIGCTFVFYDYFEDFADFDSLVLKERFALWQHTIGQTHSGKVVMQHKNVTKIVTCHPLLGFRIGSFMQYSPYSQGWINEIDMMHQRQHVYSHAHNDYLEVLFELGYIGFICLLIIIGDLIYRFAMADKTKLMKISFLCVLAQAICALGVFTVHTAVSGMLLIINLGILEGELRDEQKRKEQRIPSVVQRKT